MINIKVSVLVLLSAVSSSVFAWHHTKAKVQSINFYAHTDAVLVLMDNPGVDVPECSNASSFAIDDSLPESRRNNMVAALLSAEATGDEITISYAETGSCVAYGKDLNAYRSILRIVR